MGRGDSKHMSDSPNEKKFMRETIVKEKKPRSGLLTKFFGLCLFAVIFGIIAAVSFVLAKPVAEAYLMPETTAPSTPITIERDDDPESTRMETMEATAPEPETVDASEAESLAESQSAAAEEDIREIVQDELDHSEIWSAEKIMAFGEVFTNIGNETRDSIVTVSSVKHETDWFDNPVESTGQYAGMILAVNDSEVVILTVDGAVREADTLSIIFEDGSSAEARVKREDTVSGLVIVSVQTANLPITTRERIEPIALGNSYSVETGDMVVAVGSPAGRVHSMKHGIVNYVAKNVQAVDGQTRVFYTDIVCSKNQGTFVLNLSGELIGWASKMFDKKGSESVTFVTPISEYKGALQKLSNGIQLPYLGLMCQEVNTSMKNEGIPEGIYITDAIKDGPAYLSGIQNGDILTKIQEEPMKTMRDYQRILERLETGAEVVLTVQRKGIDSYKEITYDVTIGAR